MKCNLQKRLQIRRWNYCKHQKKAKKNNAGNLKGRRKKKVVLAGGYTTVFAHATAENIFNQPYLG
jgi:hypothetical protein